VIDIDLQRERRDEKRVLLPLNNVAWVCRVEIRGEHCMIADQNSLLEEVMRGCSCGEARTTSRR
jgi:hypothetical protein